MVDDKASAIAKLGEGDGVDAAAINRNNEAT